MVNDLLVLKFVALLLAYLWCFFCFEYRNYQVELLRQRLFIVRDQLFLKALNGVVSLDSHAYIIARQTLNGMIRYGEDLSVLSILVSALFRGLRPSPRLIARYNKGFRDALDEIPEEARREILHAYAKAHLWIFLFLLHTSVILFPVAVVLKIAQMLLSLRHRASAINYDSFLKQKNVSKVGQQVDAVAFSRGRTNDDPEDCLPQAA